MRGVREKALERREGERKRKQKEREGKTLRERES